MKKIFLIYAFTVSLIASTLHLSTSSNPARLNPLIATDSASSEIANFLFNALVKYDESGQNIIGDLAESYTRISPTVIEFKLRHGVKWHDGKPFNAEDVVFTYKLITSDKVMSPYATDFRVIKEVKALDPYTVRVTYTKPYFKALEVWMMGIVPKHILEKEGDIMGSSFNTHPIGTGPFVLTKLEFSKQIELDSNPSYFEHKPKIDKIIFHVISDPMTRFLMLKNGEIDIDGLEPMQYERQIDREFHKQFNHLELPSHSYTYLGFNLRLKKFQDPRVREALSLAINRQELVDILFLNHGRVCSGPFLPGSKGFNDSIKPPKQDLVRARVLLAAAGYDAKHPLSFEIATSNSNAIRPYAAEILQRQLLKVGVKVTLKVMEWQAFLNTVVMPKKFDTVLLGWALSLTPDPYAIWDSAGDVPGGFNMIGYHSKKTDTLIEEMESSTNPEETAELQRKIFAQIVGDNPYLFLVIPNSINVYNRHLQGIKPTINGIWEDYIDWEKK
ncbi:MAG: peptide-binding protein [Sulfuricurvum sp.]|uniref:peptide-binding protein n=1 Tax=Sulfuricurvum sp. TaxID=2025608 RepID=UPI00261055E7|nr:peptide-binding protein [Sulfuricurvum sp.]MDD2828014.1 peptide-binding protein [Sulfuricurvum sp.]MDD4948109.1 peptide-binding protein [Sulfuricurvum sp.]